MKTQLYLVRSWKRDRPSLVSTGELLGGDVTLEVPGYGFGHDEGEDMRVCAVRYLHEAIEKSHLSLAARQLRHIFLQHNNNIKTTIFQ